MSTIRGNVNIPTIVKQYDGETTSTAETIIDNKENKIYVNVNVEEVTRDCATREEIDALSDGLDNLSDRVDDLSDTKQDLLISGENIKSINGESLLGKGNLSITTYQAFPSSWPTSSSYTAKQFCDVVDADESAVIGMGYFGGAKWSDKPAGLANGDVVVEILEGPNRTKAIHLIMTSSSVYPYRWEYTYWSHGSNSGWRGIQPELISGTNIKTINNESILGEGNIDIQGGGSDFDHGGTMDGDLEVTGSITASTLSVSSDTDLSGNLSVYGTISSEGGFSGTLDGTVSTNTPKDYVFVSLGDGFSRFRRNPLIISNESEDDGYMDYVSEAIQNALDAQGSSVTISQDVAIRISNALVLWIKEDGIDTRYKYPLAQGYDYVYSGEYHGGEYWFGSFYNSMDTYDYYFVKIEYDSGFTLKLEHTYNS